MNGRLKVAAPWIGMGLTVVINLIAVFMSVNRAVGELRHDVGVLTERVATLSVRTTRLPPDDYRDLVAARFTTLEGMIRQLRTDIRDHDRRP